MKVRLQNTEEGFRPVTLCITIESRNEGAALLAIFNHADNEALLIKAGGKSVYPVLKDFDNGYEDIIPGVKYHDWY